MATIGVISVDVVARTEQFRRQTRLIAGQISAMGRRFSELERSSRETGDEVRRNLERGALTLQSMDTSGAALAAGALLGGRPAQPLQRLQAAATATSTAIRQIPQAMLSADGAVARRARSMVGFFGQIRTVGVGGLESVRRAVISMARDLDAASNRASTLAQFLGNTRGAGAGLERLARVLGLVSGELTFLSTAGLAAQAMFSNLSKGGLDLVFVADKVLRLFSGLGVNLESFGVRAIQVEGVIRGLARTFNTLFGKAGAGAAALGAFDEVFAKLGVDFRSVQVGAGGLAGVIGRMQERLSAVIGAAEGASRAHKVLTAAVGLRSPWEGTIRLVTGLKDRFGSLIQAGRNARAEYAAQIAVLDGLKKAIVGNEAEMTRWQKLWVTLASSGLKLGVAIGVARNAVRAYSKTVVGQAVVGTSRFAARLVGLDLALKAAGKGFAGVVNAVRKVPTGIKKAASAVGSFASKWLTLSGLMRTGGRVLKQAARDFGLLRSAEDSASQGATRAAGSMSVLATAARGARRAVVGLATTVGAILSPLTSLTRLLVPLAVFGGFAGTVVASEKFERSMRKSLAIMDATVEQQGRMEVAAKDVARTTVFSGSEAAESFFFLASAGLSAEESIGALPTAAKFAQAGLFDMQRATDLLTDAQSALGLNVGTTTQKMAQFRRVGDVLVRANELANASVEQFAEALTNKVGGGLKVANKSVEEGVAVLAALADQGVKAEEAGTALAKFLTDLALKAGENREAFAKYGITVTDSAGNLLDLATVVENLSAGLEGMSDTMRADVIKNQLGFQKRSVDLVNQLKGTGDAIRRYRGELEQAGGSMDRVSSKQMTDFQKGWERIKVVLLEVGQKVFQPMVDAIGRGMSRVADLVENLQKTWRLRWDLMKVDALIAWDATKAAAETAFDLIVHRSRALTSLVQATAREMASAFKAGAVASFAAWDAALLSMRNNVIQFASGVNQAFVALIASVKNLGAGVLAAAKAAARLEDPVAAFQRTVDVEQLVSDFRGVAEGLSSGGDAIERVMADIGQAASDAFVSTFDEEALRKLQSIGEGLGEEFSKGVMSRMDRGLLSRRQDLLSRIEDIASEAGKELEEAGLDIKKEGKARPGDQIKFAEGDRGVAALLKGSAEAFSAEAAFRRQSPLGELNDETKRQTAIQEAQLDEQKRLRAALKDQPRVELQVGGFGF